MTNPEISPLERRWLRWILLAVAVAVTAPYFWAWALTPYGFVYSGLLFSPDDQNVHLMWARQAAEGKFFFDDRFTTEHLTTGEKPWFTNAFCIAVGLISRLTQLPLVVVYHGLRVGFAILGLWWFHRLCARLTGDAKVRLLATALAGFSAGGGWIKDVLPFLANHTWMDRHDNTTGLPMIPEGFAFPSLFIFPLNTLSLALLALIFDCALRGNKRAILTGAAAMLLLGNIHTYDALPLGLALVVWTVYGYFGRPSPLTPLPVLRGGEGNSPHSPLSPSLTGRGGSPLGRWGEGQLAPLLIAAGALPAIIYQVLVFANSSEFKIKALTLTPPPPLGDVLLSYSPILLLALIGMTLCRRQTSARLLMLWPLCILLMIYTPLSFGRKMLEGVHLPLCFFAAVAIVHLARRVKVRLARPVVVAGLATALCFSSAQFMVNCLENAASTIVKTVGRLMPPLYLADSDWKALKFIEAEHARRGGGDEVVLCINLLGNYVPRETGCHAFVGHWAETLNFFNEKTKSGKISDVQNFYRGRLTNSEALAWLKANRITYVVEGYYENLLFPGDSPARRIGLRQVFAALGTDENHTAVFAVP